MNIKGINNINNVLKSYEKTKIQRTKEPNFREDKVEISQTGKDFQFALKAFKNLPVEESKKIEEIKSEVESGKYSIDSKEIAKAIFEKSIRGGI